jgi:hypothetical protein
MRKLLEALVNDKWNRILAVLFLLAVLFELIAVGDHTKRIIRLEKEAKMIPTQSDYDRARQTARICMTIEELRAQVSKLKTEFKLVQRPIPVPGNLKKGWSYLIVHEKTGGVVLSSGEYLNITFATKESQK